MKTYAFVTGYKKDFLDNQFLLREFAKAQRLGESEKLVVFYYQAADAEVASKIGAGYAFYHGLFIDDILYEVVEMSA